MVNQLPGQSWCCHFFPAPESVAKASVDVDFSLCWGCPSTQHLTASSGPLFFCKVLYWLYLCHFQMVSSPWLQAALAASGRRWCLLLPWISLHEVSSLSAMGRAGWSWAAPEGWSARVRRPPWAASPLQLGSLNITNLLAAAEPPAPGHTWAVKWFHTEMCQIGGRAFVGPGWSLAPLLQHPARKMCFFCWEGLCSPTSASAQLITPFTLPCSFSFVAKFPEQLWGGCMDPISSLLLKNILHFGLGTRLTKLYVYAEYSDFFIDLNLTVPTKPLSI